MKQSVGTEAQARNEADLQLALRAIGGIIRDYSPNKLFPALGFGAKIPPAFHDSQEFFLNFDTDPCCRGIDGVLDAYRKASRTVVPIDKVTFFHVIHYVAKMAMNSGVKGLHYYVLTVFTQGGPIRDLKEVLNALVYASKAPLSVIFIGIGDGDFEDLCRLTSKHQSESGKKPEREIVEFLELNSVLERGGRAAHNKRRIAERALHVVPWHLVSFMHKNNIAAKPPIQISRSPVFHASYLIPDRPSRYDDDEYWIEGNRDAYHVRPKSSTPYHQRKLSDRSPAPRPNRANSAVDDSVDLWHVNGTYVSPTMSNYLNLRGTPFRSHSAIQTPRNEIQRRIAQRRAFRFEVQVEPTIPYGRAPVLLVEGSDESNVRTQSKVARTPSDFQ